MIWTVTIPQVSPQLDSVATTAGLPFEFSWKLCSAREDSYELHDVDYAEI